MNITLVGCGSGVPEDLTMEAREALGKAELVLGAERLLEGLAPCISGDREAMTRPGEIVTRLESCGCREAAVVLSGDSGFYSGAAGLKDRLREAGMEARVLPGISSLQLLASRLGRPWQDWVLCSAHGVDCDPVWAASRGKPAFFLTGGQRDPAWLCGLLREAGLGKLPVTVGEDLGTEGERITAGTAAEFASRRFSPLSVLLCEAAPVCPRRTPGIPDGEFLRGGVPMTKQPLRALILSELGVSPGDLCWDVGAGTGGVSVELALQSRQVWAVERDPEALDLLRANREKFCCWNLRVVPGTAPEALGELPKPDKVFVGGSGGCLREILAAACSRGPEAISVSAILLETVQGALETLTDLGYEPEVRQISVSAAKPTPAGHMLLAGNPVFLITGRRP